MPLEISISNHSLLKFDVTERCNYRKLRNGWGKWNAGREYMRRRHVPNLPSHDLKNQNVTSKLCHAPSSICANELAVCEDKRSHCKNFAGQYLLSSVCNSIKVKENFSHDKQRIHSSGKIIMYKLMFKHFTETAINWPFIFSLKPQSTVHLLWSRVTPLKSMVQTWKAGFGLQCNTLRMHILVSNGF